MALDLAGDVYLECLSPVVLLAALYAARLSLGCCCGVPRQTVTRRSLQLVSVLVSTIFGTSVLLLSAWGRPFRLLVLLPADLLLTAPQEFWSLEFAWSLLNPILLERSNVHALVPYLMMLCIVASMAFRSQTCLMVSTADQHMDSSAYGPVLDRLESYSLTAQRAVLLGTCFLYWWLRMVLMLGAHRPPLKGVERMRAPVPAWEDAEADVGAATVSVIHPDHSAIVHDDSVSDAASASDSPPPEVLHT